MSQTYVVRIKRGLSTNLPASAALGELHFATDTKMLYCGTGSGNPLDLVTAASAGSGWHYASGAPSTLYTNGDYYLDTASGKVYQQITGAWVLEYTPAPAGVTSVNTKTGAVTLSYSDVGADVAGAASTAQSNAESYATSQG